MLLVISYVDGKWNNEGAEKWEEWEKDKDTFFSNVRRVSGMRDEKRILKNGIILIPTSETKATSKP